MPLYEYRCAVCGTQEEKLQPIAAAASHDCPECEAPAGMQRQLSVAAFSLAGGGWYKEGYSGAPAKEGVATDAPAEAAKSAGKPAEKPAEAAAATPAAAPSKPAGGCGGGCACH
jgi:putative FmdB family regulatory protein